jgi:hypothetical protein
MTQPPKPLLHRQLDYLAQQRWTHRGFRVLLQGLGLGLSLCAIGLGAHLIFNLPLDYTLLGILLLSGIALGAIMLLRPKMHSREVAQRLDQRFGLNEQITTALEVQERGETAGVAAYLLKKASHNTAQVQRYVNKQRRFPWVEIMMLVALLITTGGLMLLVSLKPTDIAQTTPIPLPQLVNPDDPPQEFPIEPFDPPPGSNSDESQPGDQPGEAEAQPVAITGADQQSLSALADALRDLSVMRPAAEALDQGDTAGAAQSIREVADQADQLSPETRQEIANALREAASEVGQNDPNLANDLRESAQDMEQDSQRAAEGLDKLASTVENIGREEQQAAQVPPPPEQQDQQQSPQSWEEQSQQTSPSNETPPEDQRERSRPHERLGIEGVPLELESEGEGDTPTDNEADTPPEEESNAGSFARSDQLSDDTQVQVGEDPLRIPADLRDVVQEYFSQAE